MRRILPRFLVRIKFAVTRLRRIVISGVKRNKSRLVVLLGGRVAEALTFTVSRPARRMIWRAATDLARRMVTEFGTSPELGPVCLAADPQATYLGMQLGLDSRVSPETAAQVDSETRRIVEEAVSRAWELLESHRDALDALAARRRERETVGGSEVAAILKETRSLKKRMEELAVAV